MPSLEKASKIFASLKNNHGTGDKSRPREADPGQNYFYTGTCLNHFRRRLEQGPFVEEGRDYVYYYPYPAAATELAKGKAARWRDSPVFIVVDSRTLNGFQVVQGGSRIDFVSEPITRANIVDILNVNGIKTSEWIGLESAEQRHELLIREGVSVMNLCFKNIP